MTNRFIPNPCSENYHHMDKTEKGAYCKKCNFEVIDFTTMSDEEIIQYMSNKKGRVCGRVRNKKDRSILQRIMLAASFLLVFFMSKKAKAISFVHDTLQSAHENSGNKIIIKGTIKDKENNEELPFANVVFYSDQKQITVVQTDFDGTFEVKVDTNIHKNITMKIAYVGYKLKNVKNISFSKDKTYFLETDLDHFLTGIFVMPIIDKHNTTTGSTYDSDDIRHMPW